MLKVEFFNKFLLRSLGDRKVLRRRKPPKHLLLSEVPLYGSSGKSPLSGEAFNSERIGINKVGSREKLFLKIQNIFNLLQRTFLKEHLRFVK